MRLIDADELIEKASREKLDTRELIIQMIENAPTVVDREKEDLRSENNFYRDAHDALMHNLQEEREMSRNVIKMVLNFQRKGAT